MSSTEIFVANLSEHVDEEDLRDFFEEYTDVLSVEIMRDKVTGRSKGRGFVTVDSEENAYKVIADLSNAELYGKSVILSIALDRAFYDY
jgi:RNA recognition motif-containing protein